MTDDERDAARYRWLRTNWDQEPVDGWYGLEFTPEQLDYTVDACISNDKAGAGAR